MSTSSQRGVISSDLGPESNTYTVAMSHRLHRLLPAPKPVHAPDEPDSQTADGTRTTSDELLAEAEALLAEAVPPDDDSAARVAFEERLDRVRLRLRTLWAQQALLDSEEDLLVDALRALDDVLARADAVDVSRASSGLEHAAGGGQREQHSAAGGRRALRPAGRGSTQPPDGGGEVDHNLMPPTPEDTGETHGPEARPRRLLRRASTPSKTRHRPAYIRRGPRQPLTVEVTSALAFFAIS